jgi:hypothetical protein
MFRVARAPVQSMAVLAKERLRNGWSTKVPYTDLFEE